MLNKTLPPTQDEVANASGVSLNAASNWPGYVKQCERRADLVERSIVKYGLEPISNQPRILDWGCALGGVALILSDRHDLTVHCADVDPHSLRWLSKSGTRVVTHQLPFTPNLPFDDNSFDLIYGISVLTHLSPESQPGYLKELARITAPSGLVMLTIASQGAVAFHREKTSRHQTPTSEQLDKEGIVFYQYPERQLQRIDFVDGGDYGRTFHSHEYMQKILSPSFETLAIEAGALHYQDLVILRPL